MKLSDWLPSWRGKPGKGALMPRPGARFMQGNTGPLFAKWRPPVSEHREEVAMAWPSATGRANDIIQNLGWIAGAIDQATANTVGLGLALDAKPDPKALGMTPAAAKKWSRLVEARWQVYANSPWEIDLEGRQTLAQMQAQAFKSFIATGEVVAEHQWRARPGSQSKSKVRIIPSRRIAPGWTIPTERLFQGVYLDRDWMPIGYRLEYPDIITGNGNILRDVKARDSFGRVHLSHIFEGMPGVTRGITPLVPVLRTAKRFDELADATLMSAIIQSVFAATLTSTLPTQDVMEGLLSSKELAEAASGGGTLGAYLDAMSGWNSNVQFDTSVNGRIANTFPGQELKFLTAGTPNANYQPFATHLLREMARCLGCTYESMTGDYAGVTFSSVRMAIADIWQVVLSRRKYIIAPFSQAVYANWLEEEIDAGRIPLPGGIEQYVANCSGIANAEWRGSPKPQADDLKAAKAQEVTRNMGLKSDTALARENGDNYEDIMDEIADEIKARKKRGIPETFIPGMKQAERDLEEEAIQEGKMNANPKQPAGA
jgi:lambda family phage portal protein